MVDKDISRWDYVDDSEAHPCNGDVDTDQWRVRILYERFLAFIESLAYDQSPTVDFPITEFLPATITATFLKCVNKDLIDRLLQLSANQRKLLQRLMGDLDVAGKSYSGVGTLSQDMPPHILLLWTHYKNR